MISCTVTIREKDSPNQNQELLNQLDSTATTSFQPSSNTFVVRPAQKFVSDSDPDYLETRYPDLFPFGRAGFDEKRKIKISKKALIAYYTNLSTRQFQKPDFILPVYDMIARNSSYNMALVLEVDIQPSSGQHTTPSIYERRRLFSLTRGLSGKRLAVTSQPRCLSSALVYIHCNT